MKGQEFPAVALIIPRNLRKDDDDNLTAIDHWEARTDAESRRVLYVGASRVQKLLVVAALANHLTRVRQILERDGVPFEVIEG